MTLQIQAPPDRLRYLLDLQRKAARIKQGVARYYSDPVGFANDCIDWGGSDGLTEYQEEVIGGLPQRKRTAVRGPHGLRTRQIGHIGHNGTVVRPDPGRRRS
jgi:hypothetical protein